MNMLLCKIKNYIEINEDVSFLWKERKAPPTEFDEMKW